MSGEWLKVSARFLKGAGLSFADPFPDGHAVDAEVCGDLSFWNAFVGRGPRDHLGDTEGFGDSGARPGQFAAVGATLVCVVGRHRSVPVGLGDYGGCVPLGSGDVLAAMLG